MKIKSEIKEILEVVKAKGFDICEMTVESLIELAVSNEINLLEEDAKTIWADHVCKNMKVIYGKKDGMIHLIKEQGKSNDLWYKYRDLGYSSLTVFEYKKVFLSSERINRSPNKCEFIRKNANPDISVTTEIFGGGK